MIAGFRMLIAGLLGFNEVEGLVLEAVSVELASAVSFVSVEFDAVSSRTSSLDTLKESW